MRKIYIVVSGNYGVNWKFTRSVVMEQAVAFGEGSRDFGIGAEPYFICPGCRRQLPVAIAHLDHIQSQARYKVKVFDLSVTNANYCVVDAGLNRLTQAIVKTMGGTVSVQKTMYTNPGPTLHSAVVWENDLRNLQLLCSSCNSSKGDKDWIDWGRLEADTIPLSTRIKQGWMAD